MAKLTLKNLSHIALNVSDIERSSCFYKNVLGLKIIFEINLQNNLGFSTGFITPAGVMIELIQITGMEVKVQENTSTIAFSVDSLEEAKMALQSIDIEIKNEMEFSGVRMFFISDPDGHNVEIAQFPCGIYSAAEMHEH